MASRQRLARAPHYTTRAKTPGNRFRRGTGRSAQAQGKVILHDDESTLEKKMKIKAEAKVSTIAAARGTEAMRHNIKTSIPAPLPGKVLHTLCLVPLSFSHTSPDFSPNAPKQVIMERVNKITDDYGNIISEAVPELSGPPPAVPPKFRQRKIAEVEKVREKVCVGYKAQ